MLVMGEYGFNELDSEVLQALLRRNHPSERIFFVRNQFGEPLKKRLQREAPIEVGTPEALDCEKKLKDELQQSHKKILKIYKIPEAYQHPLLFTTAKDIRNLQGHPELFLEIHLLWWSWWYRKPTESSATSPPETF